LAGCTRSITWEEGVPLNTGETIVVKRSGTYSFKSESGNPLNFGYRPDWRSTIAFTYKGKSYTHTDDAILVLLAIGPDGVPNLVADARAWGNQHKYSCVTPYYVQFRPDSVGNSWTWPEQIDSWLYKLPTNLVFGLPPLESSGEKFTQADRARKNASLLVVGEHYRQIDPTFKPENCAKKVLNGK
jgi:hypothetical protein